MNEYWLVVRRRRLLIFGCVLGGLAFAAILNELTPPVYRSSVRVEVQREASRSPLTGAVTESPTPQSDNQALYTTAQIVTSRTPMAEVVASLERQGTTVGPAQRHARIFGIRVGRAQPAPQTTPEKVDWLLEHVTVEPLRDTRLIRISVEDSQPSVAAAIANAIAENFVRYHLSQRSAADNAVASYLRTQASDVKDKINALEAQTRGPGRMGLYSLDGRIQQLTATVAELNGSYGKATTERLAVSSQLDRIRRVSRDPDIDPNEIPVRTEALDALKRDLLLSNTALAKAKEIYGRNHPKLALLQSENVALRRSLRDEINNAVAGLESQRSIQMGREVSLQMAIGQAEDELRSLNDQAQQYSSIEGELKSNRELYNLLMSRVHEAEITGQLTRPLVRIVEPASIESQAVRPLKLLNFSVSLLLGILTGVGLAFAFESVRKTIRTPKDVEDILHLPVLGLIPKDAIR